MSWGKERAYTALLNYVPGVQEAYDEVVAHHYRSLLEISLLPISTLFITDHVETQVMCDKEVDIEPRFSALVPNRLKTEKVCNKAMRRKPCTLRYVPDWSVTQ